MVTDVEILDEKLDLIQWISTIEDSSVIKKIMKIRNEETKDWWLSISEEERHSIEKGITDADDRKLVSHAEARKNYEKWL